MKKAEKEIWAAKAAIFGSVRIVPGAGIECASSWYIHADLDSHLCHSKSACTARVQPLRKQKQKVWGPTAWSRPVVLTMEGCVRAQRIPTPAMVCIFDWFE